MRIIRSIFLTSKTVAQGISAKQIAKRPLLLAGKTVAPYFGFRSMIWMWGMETLFTLGITTIAWYVLLLSILGITWLTNGGDSLSVIPVLTAPLAPIAPYVEEVRNLLQPDAVKSLPGLLTWSWFTIKETYLFLVLNTVYQNWSELANSISTSVGDMHNWYSPEYIIGIPLGVFYKVAVQPMQEMLMSPYYILSGKSTLAELTANNLWLSSAKQFISSATAFIHTEWSWFWQIYSSPQTITTDEIFHDDISDDSENGNPVDTATIQVSDPWEDSGSDSSSTSTVRAGPLLSEFDKYFKKNILEVESACDWCSDINNPGYESTLHVTSVSEDHVRAPIIQVGYWTIKRLMFNYSSSLCMVFGTLAIRATLGMIMG